MIDSIRKHAILPISHCNAPCIDDVSTYYLEPSHSLDATAFLYASVNDKARASRTEK